MNNHIGIEDELGAENTQKYSTRPAINRPITGAKKKPKNTAYPVPLSSNITLSDFANVAGVSSPSSI